VQVFVGIGLLSFYGHIPENESFFIFILFHSIYFILFFLRGLYLRAALQGFLASIGFLTPTSVTFGDSEPL
jgi:hypothetical protein